MEEEGRDLLGKRTMDFKVSYLDTGLASTYFAESDQLVVAPSGSPNSLPPPTSTPNRPNRRYKTQLRDFLSTCRSKRKLQQSATSLGQVSCYFIIFDCVLKTTILGNIAYTCCGVHFRSRCGCGRCCCILQFESNVHYITICFSR